MKVPPTATIVSITVGSGRAWQVPWQTRPLPPSADNEAIHIKNRAHLQKNLCSGSYSLATPSWPSPGWHSGNRCTGSKLRTMNPSADQRRPSLTECPRLPAARAWTMVGAAKQAISSATNWNSPPTFLHFTSRSGYARETAGGAVVSVTMDGDTGTPPVSSSCLPRAIGVSRRKGGGLRRCHSRRRRGAHALEIRSQADHNNVNFDGFYLSSEPLETSGPSREPPRGPEAIAPWGKAVPAALQDAGGAAILAAKSVVAGNGLVQSLLSTPRPRGMGGNIAGPGLQ